MWLQRICLLAQLSDRLTKMTFVYHGPNKAQWYSSIVPHHRLCSELNGQHIRDYLDVCRSQGQQISPLVVADFGTADGVLALTTIMPVIESLKKENKEVLVILNDQPANDWQKLQENKKNFRIDDIDGVMVYVSTKDFNKQCAPTGFIDFGIVSVASQYLPCLSIDKEIFTTCKNITYEEQQRISEEFIMRWKHFLSARSAEIKQGGRLSCSFFMDSSLDESRYLQLMSDVWTDMYTEGIINEHEYNKTVVQATLAKQSEILAPFENNIFAGFEILSFTTDKLSANWQDNINQISDPDSARSLYAENLTSNIQSWTRSSMASAMVNFRSSEEVKTLLDLFYSRVKDEWTRSVSAFVNTPFILGHILLLKCQ